MLLGAESFYILFIVTPKRLYSENCQGLLSIPCNFTIIFKIPTYVYVNIYIYDIKHIVWGEWEFRILKKLKEIYMNRISVFQLMSLIRVRVAFCAHGNKKSIFLPGFEKNHLKGI